MDRPFLQSNPQMDRHAIALAKVSRLVDRQLSPLGLQAINALNPKPGDTVLDVGFGAGQTLVQIAERVGTSGRVIGVDIAALLLSIARKRCAEHPNIKLKKADAQTLKLQAACLDGVYSRFGVMGFADPATAFKNFQQHLRPGGRLAFCCWRALEENELDRFPVDAVGRRHEVRDAPFSFANPTYLRQLLEGAGFKSVACVAHDQRVSCGDLNETLDVLLSVGALGQMVRETPSLRCEVEPRLRDALLARTNPDVVELSAAVWIVSAQAVG